MFAGLGIDEAARSIERVRLSPEPNDNVAVGDVLVGSRGQRVRVNHQQLIESLQNPTSNPFLFCQGFLKFNTLFLDGKGRIDLVNPQPAGDLLQPPHSSFQVLFCDDGKRHEVRRIVADAFGSYFVLDPTNLSQLRIRISEHPPNDDREEQGIPDEARKFHAVALPIDATSDGVKAFTGIVTELIAGDPRVVLIDEPEAFLHPSLASKLGYEISSLALSSGKRVFVSTHNSLFVMGCIQSGTPVNIIRLTYRGGIATARVLPSAEILQLMRNPLLRSTGVLNGLFYESVVITESDTDRAFYQEVNERLLRFKPEWGIPNCLFLNAQNKQTVHTIMRPLRKLGIPAVGIVDVDILKEGGEVWASLLEGACVPSISHQSLATSRAALKQAMEKTKRNMKREGGIMILEGGDRQAAQDLFDQLSAYGIFVVSGGEIESWLKQLGVTGHGAPWLIDMFKRMGEDPESPEYLKPSDADVWKFLAETKNWLMEPKRKGIPA
jgi:hypothetical protein